MHRFATTARPLRIAIIGAGPAGLYAADALLNKQDIVLTIDVFNRFPAPFGLVRDGVASDHQSVIGGLLSRGPASAALPIVLSTRWSLAPAMAARAILALSRLVCWRPTPPASACDA